ncbi:MAG: ParB/RepB/Spo0J family partition protein [Holosporales bacterium]|jgi:ParB family chromosome partitioning protein|nr:ParB/RepB/Spo0J family partition protein [Holosporales bacterium]
MEQKLGRGLSALLEENVANTTQITQTTLYKLKIELIKANANQPRKVFDDETIIELAESISQHGILQPIVVRKKIDIYEIVTGERRWRAAQLAGLTEVPVQIIECDDVKATTLALIENIQRANLNPIEEATALCMLMESCGCRQEDLGLMIGKSRSYIANSLRLLNLPKEVQELIQLGKLSSGHGKCLLSVSNPAELAEKAVADGWSVRHLEEIIKGMKQIISERTLTGADVQSNFKHAASNMEQDLEAVDIALRIEAALNLQARLKITQQGGMITLFCKSYEELETLVEKLISLGAPAPNSQE